MTGAEAIQKILDELSSLTATVKGLESSVHLIEANIKMLNNRAAGLMMAQQQERPMPKPEMTLTASAPTPAPIQSVLSQVQEDETGIMTYKKVFGKLVNNAKEAIDGVLIKVYDKNNEVCATAETDPAGYWEMMLRPGRYVAEYTKAGFKTANKTFMVDKSAKETEVR